MVVYWVKVNRWFDILVTSQDIQVVSLQAIEQAGARKFTALFREQAESTQLYKIETLRYVEDLVLFKVHPENFL